MDSVIIRRWTFISKSTSSEFLSSSMMVPDFQKREGMPIQNFQITISWLGLYNIDDCFTTALILQQNLVPCTALCSFLFIWMNFLRTYSAQINFISIDMHVHVRIWAMHVRIGALTKATHLLYPLLKVFFIKAQSAIISLGILLPSLLWMYFTALSVGLYMSEHPPDADIKLPMPFCTEVTFRFDSCKYKYKYKQI